MTGAVLSRVARLRRKLARARHRRRFLGSVAHLSGPQDPVAALDKVTVVALVRDGMFYLEAFLAHYRALGAARFVFCDNGSSDATVERLAVEPDCTVLRSTLPWGEIENDFRRHAAERFAPGRWCLFADMDEIFTIDGADRIGLDGLTRYLDRHGYTALVAQMLEMFAPMSLREAGELPYAEALRAFDHYDLRDVRCRPYHDPGIGFSYFLESNTVASPDIGVLFGGIRARVFGENCCLTKHPLVRVMADVQPGIHPHAAAHVACSDFTALIKHYKFANAPARRDADTLARGAVPHGEDAQRLQHYDSDPDLTLWTEQAQLFAGLRPLQEAGFLVRSEAYERYLNEQTG